MDSGRAYKKQKKSGGTLDLIPPELLRLIISYLPFKDALKTSLLSRRWRYLYREVSKISFKESEMVNYYSSDDDDEDDRQSKRADFFTYMVDWVSRYSGVVIESFELCVSNPIGFESEIKLLMEFAASRKVKNLVLDFSNPHWFNFRDAAYEEAEERSMIELTECVYELTSLVSLKLFACWFDPSRFEKPCSVKSLYFGWIRLGKITSLLSKTPLLEMLRIKHCWSVGLDAITGYNNRLTRLVFKNCLFSVKKSNLDLPMIQLFKYSGKFHHFEFVNMNTKLEEVNLEFGEEREYNEATRTQLCVLLYDLFSARTLTVCPFLLQLMEHNQQLVLPKMRTQRLILKTNLEPREFWGISFMLYICPYLETLSFQLVTTMQMEHIELPKIYAEMFWVFKFSHKCLKKTLKYVEMWNFMGSKYEVQWLEFLIQYGRVQELYLSSGLNENQRLLASIAAKNLETKFKAGSKSLKISLR